MTEKKLNSKLLYVMYVKFITQISHMTKFYVIEKNLYKLFLIIQNVSIINWYIYIAIAMNHEIAATSENILPGLSFHKNIDTFIINKKIGFKLKFEMLIRSSCNFS